MSMVIKRNHLGQAELCGSGEFVGEFVGGSFVGARRPGASSAGRARFRARVHQLMKGGVPKAMAVNQAKGELKATLIRP